MKNLLLVVVGVAIGFAVAHRVSRTEAGNRVFSEINQKAKELGDAVSDGYHKREAELRQAIGEEPAA
ncbi:hypothetical protein HQQ80_02600 [Microbacteriaceae bacterium VKM Ac-2855]|nr:hypothetical protein [Microbacteriaceae bacterium VKM Ac-2855]